jgi:hypothetical protein
MDHLSQRCRAPGQMAEQQAGVNQVEPAQRTANDNVVLPRRQLRPIRDVLRRDIGGDHLAGLPGEPHRDAVGARTDLQATPVRQIDDFGDRLARLRIE